jgi:hypothetical protein
MLHPSTIQEYLAAKEIQARASEEAQEDPEKTAEEMEISYALRRLDDPWWREAIILLAGLRRDATQLIQAMLNAHPDCLGLGIPDGVALALGPNSRVETVGEGQVMVLLGGDVV